MNRNSKISAVPALLACAALFSLLACGKSPERAESPAVRRQRQQVERIAAIEKELARLDQSIAEAQRQQQDALSQARDQSHRLSAQLADLRQSIASEASLAPIAEVPDESPSVLIVKTGPSGVAQPALPVPASGTGFFGRLFFLIVLIAIVFLVFKALNRWQEIEPEDAGEPDTVRQTPEGTIALSPEARRQGADMASGEEE